MPYQLAKNFLCHTRDLRAIDYYHNFIVTGGSDKKLNIFSYKDGHLQQIRSTDVIEKNILSLKINKVNAGEDLFVIAGFVDGHIVGFDVHCNPIFMIQHNSSISSIDFINSETFVTGSWDGKAIVWSLKNKSKICEYAEHKYAVSVFYNALNDTVISGSQDKALNMWNWRDGKKIKRHQSAHNDIIREITAVQQMGFITCSNDETLKLWSSDLQQIQNFIGHTAFVFSVKCMGLGVYASGGDDKCVKLWKDTICQQTIQLPGSVWQLTFDQNHDIIVGCSDGYLRIFTQEQGRKASPQQMEAFNKQVLQAASKKSGMSQEDIKKLSTIDQMNQFIGKKEGQIRVFRNGLNPEAYMWQGGQWVKIGDVITESNQGEGAGPQQRKYYPGDAYFEAGQYDYIFDVDDQSGVPKTIPFNDGGNPLQAAQKYCHRQGLTKGYIEQIRKFLIANSSRVPRQAVKQQIQNVNMGDLRSTPSTSTIEFNDIKDPQALMKKIRQFNDQAEGEKLNQRQLAHIQRMTNQLANSGTYYQVKFDNFEIDSLKKTLRWPKALKFPIWDLLRAFLKHYQSQALFSGLQAGHDVISQLCIGLQIQNKQAIYALILRTLNNVLIHNTNKNAMLKYYDPVLGSIKQITKSSPNLSNKNFLYAISAFLYNYSIAIIQKHLERQSQTIELFAQVLRIRLECNVHSDEDRTLMLQAGANILSKYYQKYKKQYQFLERFYGNSTNKDLIGDLKTLLG